MLADDSSTSLNHERQFVIAARQEASALTGAAGATPPPAVSVPGYAIVREIARGGMGVVYEAEQERPRRRVALKLVRPGRASTEALGRFEYEVRVLGRLQHPGIAHVFEAGTADTGLGPQPYFAMEFVAGRRLMEYVRENRLSTRERLILFNSICAAVQHAHQKGVIHRDLKPANIVVDAGGHPKVMDFGLARLTDAEGDGPEGTNESGKVMGTLPYMSPEQAAGRSEEIDIRTDIYSLGVILYEMLTDRLPYDLGGATRDEARRIICEQPPRTPRSIRRRLPRDLEFIALRALEKDPACRYQSAAVLAEDVDRYLKSLPITARPTSATYQLWKFVSRHKVPATLTAALVVLATVFGAWTNSLYAEVRQRERDNLETLRSAQQWRADTLAGHRRQLLAARSELAATLERLGVVLMQQGHFLSAELVLGECLNIRRGARDEPRWLAAYTESLLGECLTALGRYEEAEQLLLESYAVIEERQALDAEPIWPVYQRILDLYRAWDKPEEVARWEAQAPATRPTQQPPAPTPASED